jgi:putative Mg2+ transporter-C (MgtC) family protein
MRTNRASFRGWSRALASLAVAAILKAQGNVHGTATAASIWNAGVLGAAVAQERFFLAFMLAGRAQVILVLCGSNRRQE